MLRISLVLLLSSSGCPGALPGAAARDERGDAACETCDLRTKIEAATSFKVAAREPPEGRGSRY